MIESLFEQTLTGNYDDDSPWSAVSTLRKNGDDAIFTQAAAWLQSPAWRKRARGADILAQLRLPVGDGRADEAKVAFRNKTFPLLVELLERESNAMVLNSGIAALGHLYNEAAIPIIASYKDYPDENIRSCVACALGHFSSNPLAIPVLILLARDSDSDVRDWAVFGLGVQGDGDSPEIREVLLEALSDTDEDVREEAAVGLGRRQDVRLLPALRQMLDVPGLKVRVAEAAAAMLGLPEAPEEWLAKDYKEALANKFRGTR